MMQSIDYAKSCCDATMNKFPESVIIPWSFNYHSGVCLHGMEQVYLITGEEKYNKYIYDWINQFVMPDGWIMTREQYNVDMAMATNHLLRYAETRDDVEHFKKALKLVGEEYIGWKYNQYGGLYHKAHDTNQMWLDSVYMASLFLVRYGLYSGDRRHVALAEIQMDLLWDHARDEKTGLLYHAWDASKQAEWANKETGCAPEFWGRALGWYVVTASMMAEILPDGHFRDKVLGYATELCESLIKFRDEKTGMWYQVVDKGDREDNWIESSCSCLFTYAICKLIRLGVFKDDKYKEIAKKAYESIIRDHVDASGEFVVVKNTCIGTGVGDYPHYVGRPTKDDDMHGTGAFVLMATEYYRTFGE